VQSFEKSYILSTVAFFLTMLLLVFVPGVPWMVVPVVLMGGVTIYLFVRSIRQRRNQYSVNHDRDE
jgi:Flp pilus assembly protein TadB